MKTPPFTIPEMAPGHTRPKEEASAPVGPAVVTGYSVKRECFGHGEYGFSIQVHTNALQGYDNMDEKKVQAVVDQLNAQLKKGD